MNRSLRANSEKSLNKMRNQQYHKAGLFVFMMALYLSITVPFSIAMSSDPAILISVPEAMALKKNDSRTIFIDVRDAQAFEKMHIPGSIQIPLHFVRTKKYLRSMNAVLVNDGYDYTTLMDVGAALNQQGFRIFVMAGGIASWHQHKGELTGDPLGKEELHRMPASALLTMKGKNSQFIKTFINVSQSKTDTPFSSAIHYPVSKPDETGKLLQFIKEQQLGEKNGILIFNQNGEYGNITQITDNTSHTLFYLAGGCAAYTEYEKQHQAMLQPRDNRLKKIGGCTTCPSVSGHNDK